jgi:hypothetical protein
MVPPGELSRSGISSPGCQDLVPLTRQARVATKRFASRARPANASAVRTLKQFGLDGPAPLMRATAVLDQLTSQLKDGRVLSDANAERLQQAQALLGEVLSSEDDDEVDSDAHEEAAMVLNEDGTIAASFSRC